LEIVQQVTAPPIRGGHLNGAKYGGKEGFSDSAFALVAP
jgi:hypothetical protein